jgi:sRNA-binding protein
LKFTVSKQLLVFAMAWMGTRDIYTALGLTAIFTVLSEYLFNEESTFCVVPSQYRVLDKLLDTNQNGKISEQEVANAIQILEQAKKQQQHQKQKELFSKFEYEKIGF